MTTGKFIAFEGGGASGKDTQIDLLKERLPSDRFVFTREPGGTNIGEQIRSTLLSSDSDNMCAETELLLLVSSRAQLLREVIKPNLEAGRNVISSRFGLSTVAYQIYGRQQENRLPLLKKVNELALDGFQPDLYIFMDIPPEVGVERNRKREREEYNRFNEKEEIDFHRRVRHGFRQAFSEYDHKLIDGTKKIEEIHSDILQEIISLTGEKTLSQEQAASNSASLQDGCYAGFN